MATRILVEGGRACGVLGFDVRTGEFGVIRAKAVILCCGASGRLGLPASGYLYGTYENPSNAGDGYSMAYHAGAELTGIECFQINPLIKDYNGPACAYVTGPLGGHTVNARGRPLHPERLLERADDAGVLPRSSIRRTAPSTSSSRTSRRRRSTRSSACSTEPSGRAAGDFTEAAATTTARTSSRCTSRRSACAAGTARPGVWVNERGETTVPGLYAAGDMACVPHNYLLGALTYGEICADRAARLCGAGGPPRDRRRIRSRPSARASSRRSRGRAASRTTSTNTRCGAS